ncbi:hypothetical protein IOD13_12930 [Brevibacterium casei]|nr:hypothetical protein [Brevibacterium casei]
MRTSPKQASTTSAVGATMRRPVASARMSATDRDDRGEARRSASTSSQCPGTGTESSGAMGALPFGIVAHRRPPLTAAGVLPPCHEPLTRADRFGS